MTALWMLIVQFPAVPGVLGTVLLTIAYWCYAPTDRKRTEWFLLATLFAVPGTAACESITVQISKWRAVCYDHYIFSIDGLLGFQPSFILGRFVTRHPWLEVVVSIGYGALPLAMLAVFGVYLWLRSECEAVMIVRTFFLNLFVAVPIYLAIPVIGPFSAFPGFPFAVPKDLVIQPVPISGVINAIPSVHCSSALLILWFSRHWAAGKILSAMFLFVTIIATLSSGQHYFFDLLCGAAYAVGVYQLANVRRISRPAQLRTRVVVPDIAQSEPESCLFEG